MFLQVHITAIVLVAVAVLRQRWLLPFLWTDSILGFLYMKWEAERLNRDGTAFLGKRVRLPPEGFFLINLSTHLLLPLGVLTLPMRGTYDVRKGALLAVMMLALVDFPALYPSDALVWYVVAYVVLVAVGFALAHRAPCALELC